MDPRRPHYAAPPPPPSTVDRAPPPPPPPLPHYAPPHHYPQSSPVQPPPYAAHPTSAGGPALPPIQHSPYGPPGPSAQDQQNLPPLRHPAQPPYDPRDGQDYAQYNHNNRSGHATPAPVRSYSHDSAHQRTPTTPAQSGPYSSAPAPPSDGGPLPHHMDHGPHHGYPLSNGGPVHALPPAGPPPPPHHEQHPQYMTPMVENHHASYPPPPQSQQQQHMYPQHGYPGPISHAQLQVSRKKQMRATQACEQCRQRKQKCDEGSPCSFCKENTLSCQYRDTPPAKTDKNMEKLLSYMETQTVQLTSLTSKIDSVEARLHRVENATSRAMTSAEAQPSLQDEATMRKPVLDDHRTAPHKLLLLWPSVNALLRAADVNFDEGYVMQAEDRGILRVYTRGEGIDEHDGTQPGGPASPARSEDSTGDGSTPPSSEGLWGHGFPHAPNAEVRRSEPYSWGGLKPDNHMDLDVNTISTLLDSYIKHMHILHPILDKQRLRKMFDTFTKRYSTEPFKFRAPFAVAQTNSDSERPLKRQRSNGSTAAMMSGQDGGRSRSRSPERSPGNAIVLLVLALGKICLHREPLPSLVPEHKLNANSLISHQVSRAVNGSSPLSANVKPSPGSADVTPAHQPTPPADVNLSFHSSRSRRSSMEGTPMGGPRNLDVIPGLAYYAKACEILGAHVDGNDLSNAQAYLLAGLYKGQLARVKESMSWFSMAGRACINLLDRYKLYNDNYWSSYGDVRQRLEQGQMLIKDKRHNLIVVAAWSCLQLESDILAELRLPSSGILKIEDLLLLPHNRQDETYDGLDQNAGQHEYDNILLFYNAQMFLRKRLNQVHREMYGPDCLNQSLDQVRAMLKGHESILSGWRALLPDLLSWHDSDKAPADILAARLRAKYWGARYVVNRPFLDYALHIMPHTRDGRQLQDVACDVHGNPRDKAELHLFSAIEGMGEAEIWQASKRCIVAAMESTIAFDAVPDRLIVTNIHGTAHAQFGNMLVLSATYYNAYLKGLVPQDRFERLLQRTITFLRRLGPISSTCTIDCMILEKIQRLLFPPAHHIYHNETLDLRKSQEYSFHATH